MRTYTYAAKLHLRHNGLDFKFIEPGSWPEPDPSYQAPDGLIKFYFDDGNGGCGCNLSRSIHYYADTAQPILDCEGGENIEVVSIERVPVPENFKALHDGVTCGDPECNWENAREHRA